MICAVLRVQQHDGPRGAQEQRAEPEDEGAGAPEPVAQQPAAGAADQEAAQVEGAGGDLFSSYDCNVVCAKKLFFSRCQLDRALLSEIVDLVMNYAHLEKLDLIFNEQLGDDGPVCVDPDAR